MTQIWIPDEHAYANMPAIFDTGASMTIIDAELATRLGIIPVCGERRSTATATGLVALSTGILPELKLGTQEIANIPVAISNLPKELEVRCVLGMNILREFFITIDSYNRVINLENRPLPPKHYRENYSISLLAESHEEYELA